jgi:fused signal recognition particle receptor
MFGFLKEKLKQTVERLTRKVDESTETVKPTEKQKKEIEKEVKEKKEKQVKEQKKKQEKKQKESVKKKIHDEKYGIDEIEETQEEKKEEKKEEKEEKKEEKKGEKKGFFAKLKEKFVSKEEKQEETKEEEKQEEKKEVKEEPFHVSVEEQKEFEESFKESESVAEVSKETEETIPVVTQTEAGETVFEMQEKPTAVKPRKKKEEKQGEEKTKEDKVIEEEKGFFSALKESIFKTSLSEEKFEELFWELEVILLENNVAVEVIELIKKNLKKELVERKVLRGQIDEVITESLRESVEQTLDIPGIDIIEKIKQKKQFVIVFVGINGSGKTTTIAKFAHLLKQHHLSCVMAAADTFRAAAIQQLEEHANNLKVKLIKHEYGSDPAAVGFDAIKYAKAHAIDCVLIDTAGRLHSNTNLVDEMKKIVRVTQPDLKIFVGEAITGNDCVEQARKFNEAIGIDGIILAKADVDEKGGAALSVSYVTGKPILYLGTGQRYGDLEEFDSDKIIEQLGLR